ncbi:hypothetical protein ES702_01255 [subsurface metagenome]
MKSSGYITIILMVGLCFAIVGSVVNDFEIQYPAIDVNTSWSGKYDYTSGINESISGLKDKFDIIADEDEGWFSKLTAGISAIPKAIVIVPLVMFKTISYGLIILVEVGTEIGIPSFVTVFATIGIFTIVVFKLVAFWHRSKEV